METIKRSVAARGWEKGEAINMGRKKDFYIRCRNDTSKPLYTVHTYRTCNLRNEPQHELGLG